jgi:hypothetical protein
MERKKQYVLSAFHRVQDFIGVHGVQLGALTGSEGRKLLDAAVAQLEVHAGDQSSMDREIDGQSNLQKSLEVDLRQTHMQPIASFARAKLRGVPDIAALTRRSSDLKGPALVNAARAMATTAAPFADAFVQGAFPADIIAQLGAAAETLSGVMKHRANLKVGRAESTKGITEQIAQGRAAVKMLSAVIDRQFAKDKTFLAGWRAAKRVVSKPGVARGGGVAPAPTDAVAPVVPVPPATTV